MSKRNSRKGFTIVELVIVIAVIGILTAILIPTFMNLTKSAEASSQKSFLKNVNTQLAVREADPKIGGNPTMYDALAVSREYGFDIEKVTPFDDNDIIWDSVANRFAMVTTDFDPANPNADASKIVYSDGDFKGKGIELWHVYDKMPDTQKYSIYARAGWTGTATPSVTVGFDAGQHEGFTSITYQRGIMEAAQTAVIRTNSSDTTLTVNAPKDTVKHYDRLGKLVLSAIAYDCFEEYGKTAYAEASLGKIIAKTGGEVTALYATEAKVSAEMDGGVIVNAYCVSTTEAEALDTGYTNFSNSKDGNVTFQYVDENHNPLTPAVIEEAGTAAVQESKAEEEVDKLSDKTFWEDCIEGVDFYGGIGTESNPYLISSATQLALLSHNVNNDVEPNAGCVAYDQAYYKLVANIDISGKSWSPIGNNGTHRFGGHIDGNNKSIIGLTNGNYRGDATQNHTTGQIGETYGFIGFTKDVIEVKNLTMSKVDIHYPNAKICSALIADTGSDNTATNQSAPKAADGVTTNSVIINNVSVTGSIEGYDKVTGLVGYMINVPHVEISNCSVSADISLIKKLDGTSGYRAGGLFGYYSMTCHPGYTYSATVTDTIVSSTISKGESTKTKLWLGAITSGFNSQSDLTLSNFEFTGDTSDSNTVSSLAHDKFGGLGDRYSEYLDLINQENVCFVGQVSGGEFAYYTQVGKDGQAVAPASVVQNIRGAENNLRLYHLMVPEAGADNKYSFTLHGLTYYLGFDNTAALLTMTLSDAGASRTVVLSDGTIKNSNNEVIGNISEYNNDYGALWLECAQNAIVKTNN